MNITHLRKRRVPAMVVAVALFVSTFGFGGVAFAVDAPLIATASFTSSTTPVVIQGTAATGTTITVTGGADTETTLTTGAGTWSVPVDLNLNSVNTLSVVANDGVATSSAATVTVTHDNTAPVIASTTNVTANATTSAGTTVNFTAPAATDALDASVTVTCAPASGTTFASGTTTVTCTATDDAGNTATANFDVFVAVVPDITDPVFATTTDVTATATTSAGVVVNFPDPIVTDDLDATLDVVCAPASGSVFAVGDTTVTCTATDDAGNVATTTFDVIVDLDVLGDITITHPIFASGLFCATSTPVLLQGTTDPGATVTVTGGLSTASTTANGSGAFSLNVGLASNAATTLLVTTTDGIGNVIATSTLNFEFDTTAPVITLNQGSMVISQNGTFIDPGVTVTDNLDANVTATTTGTVNMAVPGTYTITYTATDCAGNVASTTRDVTVTANTGGGGSSSGRNNSSNNTNVTSSTNTTGMVDGTTPFTPVTALSPFQQVLGASAFIPGIPNTGAGGDASTNIALLLASAGLAVLGAYVTRNGTQKA